MGVTITIDFKKIEKDCTIGIKKGVNEALDYLQKYAQKESPIKSGEYNSNHKIVEARDNGALISGRLYNDTSYAGILEYGVGGKTYGYHRYGKLFMAGVGARVYTRTQDNNLKNIVAIIKKNLFATK